MPSLAFGLDQDSSVNGSGWSAWPYEMALKEEVSTTRCTVPAFVAARRTRRVPSRAGMMRSFASLGSAVGMGEAIWSTYVHPATAVFQPLSWLRSASTNVSRLRLSSVTPPVLSACLTVAVFDRERIVARTW